MSAETLYWVGLVGGFIGVTAYFLALALRPQWIRVLNGSALFFTGLGLMQVAIAVRDNGVGRGWFNANVAVVALVLAVTVQSYAVLRNRRAWDGVERRGEQAGTMS